MIRWVINAVAGLSGLLKFPGKLISAWKVVKEIDQFSHHWRGDSVGNWLNDHRNLVEYLAWHTRYLDYHPQHIRQLRRQDDYLCQLYAAQTRWERQIGHVRDRPAVLDRELCSGCVVLAHFGTGDAGPFPENAPKCGGEGSVFKTPDVEGGIILTAYDTTNVSGLVSAFKAHLKENDLTLLLVMQQGRNYPAYYEDDGHIF